MPTRGKVRKLMLYESYQESRRLADRMRYELATYGKLPSFVLHTKIVVRIQEVLERLTDRKQI